MDRLQDHVEKQHNNRNKVSAESKPFPLPTSISDSESANLASDEESTSDAAGPSSLGPIRGRTPHLQVRTTPYDRSGDSSSRSSSPLQRSLFRTASPHVQPVPSPLAQVAFSRPSSPTPPPSDDEMNVDPPEPSVDLIKPSFNEEEVLAKASFAIITLSHLQTTPPTRLLVCTKCCHGVNSPSLISHSKEHRIPLLPIEKQNLQKIMDNSDFLHDSVEVSSPTPPCSPIEGLLMQEGFSCNVCSHCTTGLRSMQTHFSEKHKDFPGFAKANSTPVKVQSFFSRRPKYFAVTPILRGLRQGDLFMVYLQQCAPEIDGLKILNPPLNTNEVPPLLKITQWHEHLKDYITDRDSVRKLLELTTLPTLKKGEAWLGKPLRSTIDAYMKDVRRKALNSSLGIRCLLKECPR